MTTFGHGAHFFFAWETQIKETRELSFQGLARTQFGAISWKPLKGLGTMLITAM